MVCVGTLPSLNPYTLKSYLSYAVSKEVGKVGTESPSFIEPVAERRDGIKAMFSKQATAYPSKTPTTSQKRKSETDPSPSKVKDEEVETTEAASRPNKRTKTEKKEDASKQVGLVLAECYILVKHTRC
jgi:hypothetical protein